MKKPAGCQRAGIFRRRYPVPNHDIIGAGQEPEPLKPSALFLLLLGTLAPVQLRAQVGGGIGGTPTAGIGGQTSTQAKPSLANGGSRSDTSKAVYVSGRVVTEDGSPLTQNVSMERLSGGSEKLCLRGLERAIQFSLGRHQHRGCRCRGRGLGSVWPIGRGRIRWFAIRGRGQSPGQRSPRESNDQLRPPREPGGIQVRRDRDVQSPDLGQSGRRHDCAPIASQAWKVRP